MSIPIALQLYTIRDAMKADLEGSLRKVADIGYQHVELAGLYGKTPAEFAALLDSCGLRAISSHVGLDAYANLADVVATARTFGYSHVGCPYAGDNFHSPKGYKTLARTFQRVAKRLAKDDITFFYHNHSFEFFPLRDGTDGMSILFDQAPDLTSELDVYWVWHGCQNPVDWIKCLKKRVPLLHIKDMSAKRDRTMAEVGTGIVDFKSIVKIAPKAGVKYYVIEQDNTWIDNDPLKSAAISYRNFKKIAKA